jgi:hypothetical protein
VRQTGVREWARCHPTAVAKTPGHCCTKRAVSPYWLVPVNRNNISPHFLALGQDHRDFVQHLVQVFPAKSGKPCFRLVTSLARTSSIIPGAGNQFSGAGLGNLPTKYICPAENRRADVPNSADSIFLLWPNHFGTRHMPLWIKSAPQLNNRDFRNCRMQSQYSLFFRPNPITSTLDHAVLRPNWST